MVPQLLTRRAEDFLWAAEELFQRGYREVNLNLGCPSGTVTAKGKGAGFLGRRAELEEFLDTVFARAGGPISVKTRLGVQDPEEFWALLELYNRYPIVELTIHPRVQKDLYRHPVRREELGRMLAESRNPVCYNGDIVTQRDLEELEGTWKGFEAVMIGRGLIADPAMVSCRQGGPALDRERLGRFLEELYQGYTEEYGGARNAMFRMKELWPYLLCRFQGAEGYGKKLRKARTPGEYENVARRIWTSAPSGRRPRPAGERRKALVGLPAALRRRDPLRRDDRRCGPAHGGPQPGGRGPNTPGAAFRWRRSIGRYAGTVQRRCGGRPPSKSCAGRRRKR